MSQGQRRAVGGAVPTQSKADAVNGLPRGCSTQRIARIYDDSNKIYSTCFHTYLFSGHQQNCICKNFYNWNNVFARYCDGGAFTGDIKSVDPATNLHFRGARIFDAVIEAILFGGSANGYPAMLYCDHFHNLLPKAQSEMLG
ncbi:pectin acetylesterase 8-like [Capsicum annuum]|uniref:pectin acetylesterase 8-like n=1 Tax=Capsicum annuum TaxID=4072 RepID=UPI0007BF5896|nr:pectin acetylesterase 8-like [Capsicum annuum]